MNRNIFSIFFISMLSPAFTQENNLQVQLELVVKGLMTPVAMDAPEDNSKRIFICEQTGKIRIVKQGKLLEQPFLDLGKKLDELGKVYSEKGLLGLAFHPDYKTNGRFFVYYTAPPSSKDHDHLNIVSSFKVSSDPDKADPASETMLMQVKQPQGNHCGGQLAFGPDGFLYIGMGDGGSAGDPHGPIGNAQNLGTFMGKILRVDVDSKTPYAVPPDNPFFKDPRAKPEIWAYGLRNPWRFSFDKKTKKLFCADVGQNKWEEIDIIEKGKNYGWRIMEASHCFNPESGCDQKGLQLPVAEYGRDKGISVTGGYVYRGTQNASMQGKYFFGDWKGKMYYLEEQAGKWTMKDLRLAGKSDNDADLHINSFGEDSDGEIYLLGQKTQGTFLSNGVLLRLKAR